jgi:hypothetical protein
VVALDHLLKKEGLDSSKSTNDFLLEQIKQKMENKKSV